jgi:hypothetical protein
MVQGSDLDFSSYGFTNVSDYMGGPYSASLGAGDFTCSSGMLGGGKKSKKSKQRRKVSKKVKQMTSMAVKSMQQIRKKRLNQKKKNRKFHKEVIKSIEYNEPISRKAIKGLSPSVHKFLEGIESRTNTLTFSDYKQNKKNNKLVSRVRGGNHHTEKRTKVKGGRCNKKKTKRKRTSFWDW